VIVPTVLRFVGLRVVIYFNDHRPAHVHVIGRGCEAVFDLHCPAGPAALCENYGFSRRDIATIESNMAAVVSLLCQAWEEMHGIQ
jgi:Fe2+ or Zn2+ uptake regulation protein